MIILTVLARSPSSSLMTAEKLLLVISRNSQHLRIVFLSQPEVACSCIAVMSRFCSWKSEYWSNVRNSNGWVTSRVSHARAPMMNERKVSWREKADSRFWFYVTGAPQKIWSYHSVIRNSPHTPSGRTVTSLLLPLQYLLDQRLS